MKKAIVILLTIAFLLLFVGTAFAASGPTYRAPGVGDTPHGSYAATNDECEICHSPHEAGIPAGVASYKLLRATTKAAACDYCHGASGAAVDYLVYQGTTVAGEHTIGAAVSTGIPDSSIAVNSLYCYDCHSVHGANTLAYGNTSVNAGVTLSSGAILKNNPIAGGAAATTLTGFCADCHTHNLAQMTDLQGATYDHMGITHPMVDSANSTNWVHANNGGTASGVTSEDCIDCHKGTGGSATGGLWPHQSAGAALINMTSAPTVYITSNTMDANCMTCHSLGVGQSGAGGY